MRSSKLQLIASMVIFGTIGLFVRHIPLPSSVIAFVRGGVGMLFLLLVMALQGKRIDLTALKEHWLLLLVSGAALGINWILLFESYRHTTVAVSTMCYYLSPLFTILLAPVVLRERLTLRKGLCVLVALAGIVCVSGVLGSEMPGADEIAGILFGVGSAVLYACVVLLNKKITGVSGNDRTVVQLGVSALVVLPYVLLTEDVSALRLDRTGGLLLLVVAVVHTGVAYALYFNSMHRLRTQTLAIFSYIDPITAILLSALFLREPMGVEGIIGAALILGSAFVSELPEKKG